MTAALPIVKFAKNQNASICNCAENALKGAAVIHASTEPQTNNAAKNNFVAPSTSKRIAISRVVGPRMARAHAIAVRAIGPKRAAAGFACP